MPPNELKQTMASVIFVDIFDSDESFKFIKYPGSSTFVGKLSYLPWSKRSDLLAVKSSDESYKLMPNNGKHQKTLSRKIVRCGEIYKIVSV